LEKLLEYGIPGFVVICLMLILGLVVRPMVRTFSDELHASREERQQLLFPMIEAVTKLTANIEALDRRSSESHAATLEVLHGLKSAVDILCSRANGGRR
jgi:hypothetical protein